MRRLFLFLGIIFLLTDCKKDESPAPEIETIVGKWRLTESEFNLEGTKVWKTADANSNPSHYVFRFDGVILDSEGFRPCCGPATLTVNGVLFTITPKKEATLNPMCASVLCQYCLNWDIQQTGDEMTISFCGSYRQKFVRE